MYGVIGTCTSISITIPGVIAHVYGIRCHMSFSSVNNGILARILYHRVA
jgi:hypothetical protein